MANDERLTCTDCGSEIRTVCVEIVPTETGHDAHMKPACDCKVFEDDGVDYAQKWGDNNGER